MTTETPPKKSKGPRKPRINLDMLQMSGVMMPDGRSMAAKKASGATRKRLTAKEMRAKMMAGKGNPAGKDLSPAGKMQQAIEGLKELLPEPGKRRIPRTVQPAKKGGLMKGKKKKAKKSKTAGRLAKRGYGAAKK
tara:strand:- start:60 stop:464 length:405 start_codon:yes stop_codon:yes gene_type:complete